MKQTNSPSTARLISFSGVDGAGKSTQIANLISFLEHEGQAVTLITFWDDVVMLKDMREGAGRRMFKGDQGVGSPDRPIHRRDKNVRSPWMTLMRMGFYLLDALSLRTVVKRTRNSKVDVILFDRYLYDELANLNLSNPAVRLYVRLLIKFAPPPAISFVLDADPEQAYARKPEYPLEFLHSNRRAYLKLGPLFGATVIPVTTIEAAKKAVVQAVQQHDLRLVHRPQPAATDATHSLP